MEPKKLEATLEERDGKKGKYLCVVIKLTPEPNGEKIVFLEKIEQSYVNLYYSKNK